MRVLENWIGRTVEVIVKAKDSSDILLVEDVKLDKRMVWEEQESTLYADDAIFVPVNEKFGLSGILLDPRKTSTPHDGSAS